MPFVSLPLQALQQCSFQSMAIWLLQFGQGCEVVKRGHLDFGLPDWRYENTPGSSLIATVWVNRGGGFGRRFFMVVTVGNQGH